MLKSADGSGPHDVLPGATEDESAGCACRTHRDVVPGLAIVVEDVTLDPPVLGWNSARLRIRNLSDEKQACLVTVEVTGGFWFQNRTRVFHYEIGPGACETFEAHYSCPSSAQGKVRVSVGTLAGSYEAEQSSEGEPIGPSGSTFIHLSRGAIELYAKKGGYAEANAERVLTQRLAALTEICSFLGVSPVPATVVLYDKAEEKTFDTGHLGVGWARGILAVEVLSPDMELEPYHEMVHVQAEALGNPPAVLSEGLAVYLEERLGGSSLKTFCHYPTIDQAAEGLFSTFWPLETLFAFTEIGSTESRPGVAYPQAASVVKYLITTYGRERFLEAYRRLRNGNARATVEENKRLITEILGTTLPKIENEWSRAIQTRSGLDDIVVNPLN